MPSGDRTGPAGLGPMTGRGAGYCGSYPVAGFINSIPGRGFSGWACGGGGGRGRGKCHWFYATGLPGWQRPAWDWPVYGGQGEQTTVYASPFSSAITLKRA